MIALYHFITFITLLHLSLYRFYRIYHLITFLMKKPSLLPVIIGTGFGSGFSPLHPALREALLATLIWFGLSYLVSSACLLWLTVALILVFTLAGIWAANRLEASWGEDPSRVVVDEMVGVWIALLAAPPDMYGMHWEHLSCSVCLIYSSPWAFAVWKVCRVESG